MILILNNSSYTHTHTLRIKDLYISGRDGTMDSKLDWNLDYAFLLKTLGTFIEFWLVILKPPK